MGVAPVPPCGVLSWFFTPVVVFLALSLELLTACVVAVTCVRHCLCLSVPAPCIHRPPSPLAALATGLSPFAFHSSCWSPVLLATFRAGPHCY